MHCPCVTFGATNSRLSYSVFLPAAFPLSQSPSHDWLSLSRLAWHSGVFKHTHEPAYLWHGTPLPARTMPALPITFVLRILSFQRQSRGLSERVCTRRFFSQHTASHSHCCQASFHLTSEWSGSLVRRSLGSAPCPLPGGALSGVPLCFHLSRNTWYIPTQINDGWQKRCFVVFLLKLHWTIMLG